MVPTLVVDYADLISTQERIACAMFLALFAVRFPTDTALAHPTSLTDNCVKGNGHAGYRSGTTSLSPQHRSRPAPLHNDSTMPDDGTYVRRGVDNSECLARYSSSNFSMASADYIMVLEGLE